MYKEKESERIKPLILPVQKGSPEQKTGQQTGKNR